jgi:hypothetical protein
VNIFRESQTVSKIGLFTLALTLGVATAMAQTGWTPAPSTVINPSKNTALDAWEASKSRPHKPSVDQHLNDPVLHGAIDVHAHFGPDSYDRQWDAFEIAKLAKERGMRGIVLKDHWSEAAGIAYLVRKYGNVPGFEVFGGLALNATVGGINPQAVRYFAEVTGHYGKVVWMPTHDSQNEVLHDNEQRPYVIVSKEGKLLPEVLEVLDLIAQYKLTLATGHIYAEEMVQIVGEANNRGIEHIIITHPGLGPQFTDPTIEQLKQVTARGAVAEVVAPELSSAKLKDNTLKMIKVVGPAHCLVSTDSGLVGSPNHPDALAQAAKILREAGFRDADLELMFKINPAKVLGLSRP